MESTDCNAFLLYYIGRLFLDANLHIQWINYSNYCRGFSSSYGGNSCSIISKD